jgi:hypothetical protein
MLVLSVGMTTRARAEDTEPTDPLVEQLEHRNADRDTAFDREAQAAQAAEFDVSRRDAAAEVQRHEEDQHAAADYQDALTAAHRSARRRTGVLLGTIALGIAGGAMLTYMSASSDEDAIRQGGFATGADISSTADTITIKQSIAYGGWGVAGTLAAIGLGLAW